MFKDFTSKGISLQDVAQKLAGWPKPIHMATLPWVQNDQGWKVLSRCVAALEIFPDEQTNIFPGGVYNATITLQCVQHAFDEGLTQVTLMLKTKLPPASYGAQFQVCHSLYTGDDITPSAQAWNMWKQTLQPCVQPAPPPPPNVPLTEKQFPYTGPFVEGDRNHPTIKGLKRGQIRLGNLKQTLGKETDDFGVDLETALKEFQTDVGITPTSGKYGRNTWLALRSARVPAEFPNAGQYAMDARALAYVREDAIIRCYPHPKGALSEICQGLHPTAGLTGNWAIDFCAPGGTKVVAVERAKITRLSGRDPSQGADQVIGIFGWSIHYETAEGYRYFSTHYGSLSSLSIGQIVDIGQVLGTVGHWPGDPPRSHTHLGVTSPLGSTDAKKRITAVSQAPKVT